MTPLEQARARVAALRTGGLTAELVAAVEHMTALEGGAPGWGRALYDLIGAVVWTGPDAWHRGRLSGRLVDGRWTVTGRWQPRVPEPWEWRHLSLYGGVERRRDEETAARAALVEGYLNRIAAQSAGQQEAA